MKAVINYTASISCAWPASSPVSSPQKSTQRRLTYPIVYDMSIRVQIQIAKSHDLNFHEVLTRGISASVTSVLPPKPTLALRCRLAPASPYLSSKVLMAFRPSISSLTLALISASAVSRCAALKTLRRRRCEMSGPLRPSCGHPDRPRTHKPSPPRYTHSSSETPSKVTCVSRLPPRTPNRPAPRRRGGSSRWRHGPPQAADR